MPMLGGIHDNSDWDSKKDPEMAGPHITYVLSLTALRPGTTSDLSRVVPSV